MWSDQYDNNTEDDAEASLPAFEEKAWDKMLPLLDEHLPQQKKRRLPLLLLLIALTIATVTVVLVINRNEKGNNKNIAERVVNDDSIHTAKLKNREEIIGDDGRKQNKNENTIAKEDIGNSELNRNTKKESDINDQQPAIKNGSSSEETGLKENTRSAPASLEKKYRAANGTKSDRSMRNKEMFNSVSVNLPVTLPAQENNREKTLEQQEKKSVSNPVKASTEEETNSISDPLKISAEKETESITSLSKTPPVSTRPSNEKAADTATISETALQSQPTDSSIIKETPVAIHHAKAISRNQSRFTIGVSAGPDVSSVGLNNPGKLKMQAGLSIGFDVSSHFTIRTGIFVSRKIYAADSADYHPPSNFWTYYPNLQGIRANCFVYEVPLNVAYTFNPANRHSWFVSTGLSSYIMKKETYAYDYKNAWGQDETYVRDYKNENSHWFSVLSISGGYRYRVNERFTLLGEPYVRVPLAGVGFGKVKLNSAGLLITASFKPFQKKK